MIAENLASSDIKALASEGFNNEGHKMSPFSARHGSITTAAIVDTQLEHKIMMWGA